MSGETGTVACDGRRAISMQGAAAADGESCRLDQRKRADLALFFFAKDLNPRRSER